MTGLSLCKHRFLLCLAIAIVYFNSLFCDFVFDDFSAVKENPDLRSETPLWNLLSNDFWGTPLTKEISHKSYRPVTVLTFRWNFAIHGLKACGYHALNILFHAVATLLFYEVLRIYCYCDVIQSSESLFASALLFAVHPIHSEAVTGVVGRAECLCACFFCGALLSFSYMGEKNYSFVTKWLVVGVLAFLATFSKEQGITVLGVVLVWHLINNRRILISDQFKFRIAFNRLSFIHCWRDVGACIICTVTVLWIRVLALKGSLPTFTDFDNPASTKNYPVRHLTYNYLVSLNAWLLLCPDWLCADWTMRTVSVISGWTDVRNLLTFSFYALFCMLCFKSLINKSRVMVFALSLLTLPFLPSSNLVFPVGFVIAERVLYLPSMGFCLLVGIGYGNFVKMRPKLSRFLFSFTCLIFMLKTHTRNYAWYDDLTLFSSAVQVTQRNAKVWNNIGHYWEGRRRYLEALPFFLRATEVQPDDVGAWLNVGRTHNSLGNVTAAERALLRAKSLLPQPKTGHIYHARVAPAHLNIFINLGHLYKNTSRLRDAELAYRQAIAMRADFVSAYLNLGDILLEQGRAKEARQTFEAGLKVEPNNADLWFNLGILELKFGENSEMDKKKAALKCFEHALKVSPSHFPALINSAMILQQLAGDQESRKKAIDQYRRTLELAQLMNYQLEQQSHLWIQIGTLEYENRDLHAALQAFEQALSLEPHLKSALINVAIVQLDLYRVDESFETLQKLLNLHPSHVKGWMTLCDLYINFRNQTLEAERCYQKVLELEPRNFQARHNLCICFIDQRRRLEAESCIAEAEALTKVLEHYTVKHVDVLRARLQKIK